jgi:hypothetical protein
MFSRYARFFLRQYTGREEIYQMAVIYYKWAFNMPTYSTLRPSIIYPDWDIWFENKPSGNSVWL